MKKAFKLSVAASAAVVTVLAAGSALAQDASANASTSGQVGMALPGAAAPATATAGDSDHDQMVGRLAVGYMGRFAVPIATGGDAATGAPIAGTVNAPAVGVRYWIDQMIGIDAGLGLHMGGGSTTFPNGTSVDDAGQTAFLIHGGVPLSLASAGHFSFQVIPEVNVGFSSSTIKTPNAPDVDLSGFLLDVGARVGGEIQFGFMGIPQLSLTGSVGLLYQMNSVKYEVKDAAGTNGKHSAWQLATTVNNNPWDLFAGNITALYYF